MKIDLLLAVPCLTRGGVHPRTAQSLWALDIPDRKKRIVMFPVDRPTTSARSDCIRIAQGYGAQALLFVDSDMEFEPDAYRRLDRVDADIVCGLFWNRVVPSYPTICTKVKDPDDPKMDALKSIGPPWGDVREVDACGMAFTLIRKRVIDAFEYPAFQHLGAMSEDYVFCIKARAKGFTIKCDTGTRISHRGDVGFNGQPVLTYKEMENLSFPFGKSGVRDSWKIV